MQIETVLLVNLDILVSSLDYCIVTERTGNEGDL